MNKITKMSVQKNKKKVQKETDTDTFWLWKISYHKCRCIRKNYESTIAINQQSRMKMINHMLCMKANIYRTMIWCSQ